MGMREKLIELIWYAENVLPLPVGTECEELVADHLIANDVVPVVRCKDCVYGKNNYLVKGLCLCEKTMHHAIHGDRPKNALMCEDDFCSYGERREG